MSKTTVNHKEIQDWAEERGGTPSLVGDIDSDDGILRIDFGKEEEGLTEISWEQFFKLFDENNLAFLYEDQTDSGEPSRFNKFIDRENAKSA